MAWLLLLVPSAAAVAVLLCRHRRSSLLAVATAGAVATLVVAGWAAIVEPTATWRWSEALELGIAVEGLARVLVVLVPAIALPVTAFAASSMRDDAGLARLLALLHAFVGAMLLLVAARDLLTLLVGWELVAALSWWLIAHEWRDEDRPRRAAHAFLTTRVGGLGLVAAAAVAVGAVGSGSYGVLPSLDGWEAHVVAGGLLVAAAAKSAQLPFSPWLFSAMAGPSPVSALLHSATMVAAGAYALARTVPLIPGAAWLPGAVAGVGLATALAGGLVATVQTDLKRALAASTSAQYGLIFVAVGAGSTAAAGAHLVTHATFKALLFLGAGVVLHTTRSLDLGSMRRTRSLRVTAVTFTVGALALAAVPPLGGARSKELILASAAHDGVALAAGVVAAAFLSALYAGRVTVLAFGGPPGPDATHASSKPLEHGALLALAVATVVLGALWLPGADDLVESITGGVLDASAAWELPASLAAAAAAGATVALLHRAGRLLTLGLPGSVRTPVMGWFGLPALSRVLVVDPVLALARVLTSFDDRVVDAGVRAAARIPPALSRTLSWWGERSVDGAVHAVAGGALRTAGGSRRFDDVGVDGAVRAVAGATMQMATGSRRVDEDGVDRAVEELARGTGVAGTRTRGLQTGLTHHYYVIAGVGLAAIVVVTAIGR
ncbi:MAG: NADH-quinone oxidoreductase subunit L [Actinomycetota bacterium]|nr:NADH-quinone oxidoreductase subunit L [Actinomycetota bacterium]